MTVEEVLKGLNFQYGHCCIKTRENRQFTYLGGGSPEKMVVRFGDLDVECSFIIDNVLVLVVK